MNVLLLCPSLLKADIRHYQEGVEKRRGIYPSLGISYIASSLLQHRHKVLIIDIDTEDQPWRRIRTVVKEFRPDLIGFHTMTWTFRQANELAKRIKELRPEVKLVVGGPNVTCFPRLSLEISEFDFAVKGEGELTIVELVDALENSKNLGSISGLLYKENGKVIQNGPRTLIKNLDEIPFPAWQLLPVIKYYDVFTHQRHFATLTATRGCPYNCIFCERKIRMGMKWRSRSPENIAAEIRWLISQYGIGEFMFFDDNFIIDHDWVYRLCEEIERLDKRVLWECRARVDMVDRPLLKAMKDAGCYRIRYGMESGDNEILKILKKGITVEQSLECARMSKEVGIEIFAYFMMGSPYETLETMEKTLQLALKVNADFAVFSKTILIVGSELFTWAAGNGYIDKNYWKDYLLGKETNPALALSTDELPEYVVDEYISLANKKFYLRPQYLMRRISKIRNVSQLYRQLQMARAFLLPEKAH